MQIKNDYVFVLLRYKILFVVIHAKSHSLKVDCDLLTVMLLHSHALTSVVRYWILAVGIFPVQ